MHCTERLKMAPNRGAPMYSGVYIYTNTKDNLSKKEQKRAKKFNRETKSKSRGKTKITNKITKQGA